MAKEIASAEGESSATIVIPYNRAFTHITALRARSLSPLGGIKTFTLDDAHDQPIPGAGVLYSDARALTLQMPYRA